MKKRFENISFRQADLVISILPHVLKDNSFALHGGTAINFFIRDLPRISVDIDLIYLKILPREKTLENISNELNKIFEKLNSVIPGVEIKKKKYGDNLVSKLFVKRKNAMVKIEPNLIIRGNIYEAEERDISNRAEEIFEKFVTVKTLSFAELYGSKICAALDRQHPRDLFDIKLLLENEGISEKMRKAFLVYLISSNRPMSELLSPNYLDIKPAFEKEFTGMTLKEEKLEDLIKTREKLVKSINKLLTYEERKFLLSFNKGKPKWDLLDIEGAKKLPAVRWKLLNINKMDSDKHEEVYDKLKKVLNI